MLPSVFSIESYLSLSVDFETDYHTVKLLKDSWTWTDKFFLSSDNGKNPYTFLCDVNLLSACTNQKQLRKILMLTQTADIL